MSTINFSEHLNAQDMIKIIMKDKGLSAEDAIKFSVSKTIYQMIRKTGYASIALDLWGHDDPEREWNVLDTPVIEVEFDELSKKFIYDIMEKEKVDFEIALAYFLLFTMEALGYHI